MANNNNNKVLNVPTLRFKEFTGEWKKTRVGELAIKVGSGVTPRGGKAVYKKKGHPFVRSQNVGLGHLLLDNIAYIDEKTHQKQSSTILKFGDVLLNITGASIGRSTVVNQAVVDGNVNQHVCIIRPKEVACPEFLCNFLLSNYGQKQIDNFQAGGNRKGLNFEQIKSIHLNLPSLREQQRIANLLGIISMRIATQNKIIEDLKKLKFAIYQKVFCQEKVKLVSLGDLCNIVKGKQLNGDYLSDNGKYYVMNGGVVPSGYYSYYNSESNTISISEGGNSCGYVQHNNEQFWSGGHCYTLQNIASKISTMYLYHYLKYRESSIMKLRIGSGLPNIQKKDLLTFKILLPKLERQNLLTQIFISIDSKCKMEKNLLKEYYMQKQFILQQMFI